MAASMQLITKVLFRLSPTISHPLRQYQNCLLRLRVQTCPPLSVFVHPRKSYCKAASLLDQSASLSIEAQSRYKERPWDYLESEGTQKKVRPQTIKCSNLQCVPFALTEYIEKYGNNPVWAGYRRNHKGGIPPQKTRKTCIRGDKTSGNPCPICRDQNIIVHHQNVKLLQQFISPHTGIVYDPTRTGVCMKQQKKLNEAIKTAQDHGLLPFQIPYVNFSEDYSNAHDAVGSTPPPSSLTSGDAWYKWYKEVTPDENEVAKVKKTYKAYLKETPSD